MVTHVQISAQQEQPLQTATPSLQEHNVVQPRSNTLIPDLSRTYIWTIS